jgi:predicted nuclease of predicted toxin-antitoxin system
MPWIDLKAVAADNPQPTEREKRQVEDYVRRRAKPRFYADENFPTLAIKILGRIGADVLTVHDARLRGHPDENHTAEALRLGRILITCDRDYLDDRRFPLVHCPTVIVCDFGSGSVADIIRTFNCLRWPFKAPQFYDKWTKIYATRDGWTERKRYLNGTSSRNRYRVHQRRIQEWVDD